MSADFKPLDWSFDTNIYEVNLRQYTPEGTFEAFSKELPRLKEMGIEILWFMPITPISVTKRLGSLGSYYACSDYTNTNPEFGSVEDFRKLVQAAHQLNLKVIIDWVANHTGWDHRWTKEHPEFYRINADGNFFDANGWEDVIDLNYYNGGLRSTMIEAMRFWINECDIDGFRCDMAMLVPLDFWRQAREALDQQKKLFWLAECEEVIYHDVFDATYGWKLLHTMEALWRREIKLSGLKEVLQSYHQQFPPTAFHALFTTNHDENSHSGSEYERMGDAAEAFAVLCCMWNGIPLIYSGQELPNLKRLKFFDKDLIPWRGQYELQNFYKEMLQLRKRNKALRAGDPAVTTFFLQTNFAEDVLAFSRKCDTDEIFVIINFSGASIELRITDSLPTGKFRNIFTGEAIDMNEKYKFDMEAWDFAVFEKRG
ncbi:MAG: alpha-glucosidase C-terminal domain-containing protein [Bacteroidetes bacterium]|nr:alpha-glucosidase C-terminal domain-containing protein [Bacteroidota bacterium]